MNTASPRLLFAVIYLCIALSACSGSGNEIAPSAWDDVQDQLNLATETNSMLGIPLDDVEVSSLPMHDFLTTDNSGDEMEIEARLLNNSGPPLDVLQVDLDLFTDMWACGLSTFYYKLISLYRDGTGWQVLVDSSRDPHVVRRDSIFPSTYVVNSEGTFHLIESGVTTETAILHAGILRPQFLDTDHFVTEGSATGSVFVDTVDPQPSSISPNGCRRVVLANGRIHFLRTERPLDDDTGNEQRLLNAGSQQQPDELWVCITPNFNQVFGLFGENRGVYGYLGTGLENGFPVLNYSDVSYLTNANDEPVFTVQDRNQGDVNVTLLHPILSKPGNTVLTAEIRIGDNAPYPIQCERWARQPRDNEAPIEM